MLANKLLIVEDSKAFAEMLKTLVERTHGFPVDIIASFAELKKLISNQAIHYFAAVVDHHLPDAPSGEAIDLVVESGIPTIVFTGKANEKMVEDLWGKNISDYTHKSSSHSIEYVVWMVKRLHSNIDEEVLVVDESQTSRNTMRKLLKTQCFKVHQAETAEQALLILDKNPRIRLAILDCALSDMNGFALATQIRSQKHKDSLEIIGLSSRGGRSNSAQFMKAGADDFLLKPFLREEFLCRVNRAVDRIDQYQKLKELNTLKNQFLSTAAHDIRGPLAAIYSASKLLQKKDCPPERRDIALKMIENNSSDMQILLNDLLDLSTIESGKIGLNLNEINLEQTLADRVLLYSTMTEDKNINVETHFDAIPKIQADRIKLNQAIDNLITNAIKYTPNNGKVCIELIKRNNKAIILISDSGKGLSKEDQSQLFQPFRTLSTQSTGGEKQTGLGLVIAKTIVEAHNGTISYRDSKYGGACFSISIPYNNEEINDLNLLQIQP